MTQSESKPDSIQASSGSGSLDVPILVGIITILVAALTAGVLKIAKILG
jgi:hypothetical protein